MVSSSCLMVVKVNLTDNAAERESRLNEHQAELARSQVACARLSQVSDFVESNIILHILAIDPPKS